MQISNSLKKFICQRNTALSQALKMIDANVKGFLIVLDGDVVVGVLTDGDIRRYLINNSNLTNLQVKDAFNSKFVYASLDDPQEKIISLFNSKIKFLPIIDERRRLINIQFSHEIKFQKSSKVIRTRAPARITFGGGGSDKFNFFENQRGLCINAAIQKFAFCSLLSNQNNRFIKIESSDFNEVWEFDSVESLYESDDPRLLIYKKIASFVNLTESVTIRTNCDFPIGSGLGGSSALSVALLHAFSILRGNRLSKINLAKQAYKFERIAMAVNGGWQDQYVAALGGVNAIHFSKDKHHVHNINLSHEVLSELQASLYLCYSGKSHDSSAIHHSIDLSTGGRISQMKETVRLAEEMLTMLTDGELQHFDRNMNKNWQLKKQYSHEIADGSLLERLNFLRSSGASSAKILGAGGGGYFLVRVPFENERKFRSCCAEKDFVPERVLFDMDGVKSW